ncbi:MAG: phosphoribosyl-ATP diphosphatase [Pseudomonadota bacterium]
MSVPKDLTSEDLATLARLTETIEARRSDPPDASYTAALLAKGTAHCARKFGEEAVETIIAGTDKDKEALCNEAADTVYHLLVLLAAHNLSLGDVTKVLAAREGTSGHHEKASRPKS